MKKKGFTLVEVVIVTGILSIVMMLFSPLMKSFLSAQDRLYNQSKVDSRLNEVVDFIKRDVRNARSSTSLGGEPVGVFDEDDQLITDGSEGQKVKIYTVGLDGTLINVEYFIEGKNLKLRVDSGNSYSVLNNLEVGSFKYKDRILLFHFKILLPERLDGVIRNEVRDIGITRVNLQ